jgi:sugar lactone lactonase YvrE
VFVRSGGVWTQQQELTASDDAPGDAFGFSVSLAGDTAVIGATGKNSNQGAAYVFLLSEGVWAQQQELTVSDGAVGDSFGNSVSASGNTVAIGAYGKNSNQGAAYVFARSVGVWTQQQELTASDGAAGDYFGRSVSVSGGTAAIGAPDKNSPQGAAYVFTGPVLGANALLVGSAGGSSSVVLACSGAWTATANDSFLHISAGSASGTGNAVVVFTYDAFSGVGTRTGTLSIAGLTVTVTQAGTNYMGPGPVLTLVSPVDQYGPWGVAVDGSGNVYFTPANDTIIKEWSASTQQVTTLASSGLLKPEGLAVDGAGNVYVADPDIGIMEWNAAAEQLTAPLPGLGDTDAVAVDGAGNVYSPDNGYNVVKEWIASTQQVTTLVSSGLDDPDGVAVDSAGNVYIADNFNDAIKEWNVSTQQVATLASEAPWGPLALTVDGSGNVYALRGETVARWSPSTMQLSTLVSTGINDPHGVAVDGSGNVYIADTGNNAIKEMPYVFVGPASVGEVAAAGSDSLLPVLPSTTSLAGIFAPTSDASWLTIGTIANGIVNFSFTANTSTGRVAHITVLGQQITVTQSGVLPGPVATITSISPSFTIAGGGPFTLTVNGSGFISASVVQWNGADLATIYVSATELTATPTTAELASAGTASITVYTAPPGGGTSNAATFTLIAQSTGLQFYTMTPCRVLDTRAFAGFAAPFGAPALAGGSSRSFPLPSSTLCSIPASAAAYSLNVTAVPSTGYLGWITVWATGQAEPVVSTLNAWSGLITANAAIVPAGTGGAISIYASDPTDVFVDINGYFAPPQSSGLDLYTLTPCRVADTRLFAGFPAPFGPPSLAGNSTRAFPVLSSMCNVSSTATAYALNVTAVPDTNYLGWLTVWRTEDPQPVASTLNAWTGLITANAAIVPVGTGGSISFYASDATDLFFDINGYFAPPRASGLKFYPVTPCRVADTRSFAGMSGAFGPPSLAGNTSRSFPVPSSACGIPSTAVAYSLNMTAAPSGGYLGWLTTWPSGTDEPVVSTLNAWDGLMRANAAIVPAGADGAISVYVSDAADVFFDINGYFAPQTGSGSTCAVNR